TRAAIGSQNDCLSIVTDRANANSLGARARKNCCLIDRFPKAKVSAGGEAAGGAKEELSVWTEAGTNDGSALIQQFALRLERHGIPELNITGVSRGEHDVASRTECESGYRAQRLQFGTGLARHGVDYANHAFGVRSRHRSIVGMKS